MNKPGHDEHGWPKYDAAWWWHEAIRWPLAIGIIIAAIEIASALAMR